MGHRERPLTSIGARTSDRTLSASTRGDAALAVVVVALGLVLAWVSTYLSGGSKTSVPHAFYIPLIVAAIRFGGRGALVVSIAAAIAAGPLMPLDVEAGTTQASANWVTRGLIFVVVGQITAYLVRHSISSITDDISGRRMRRDLSEAIESDQLRLDYQPIVALPSGGVAGVEALIRWQHPTRGLICPDDFIPHAERIGCIDAVTRWVVSESLHQAAVWRTSALAGQNDFTVSVNLSARDLADPDLVGHIRRTLEETGVPPSWLHLEITETALLDDVEASILGLGALRSLGVRIAMDDFGAGESSLGQLGRLSVDVLKIDRSFLQQPHRDEFCEILLAGIADLAANLGVVTVVEGVETLEHATTVIESRCGLAQGFLFSRPVTPGEIEALLAENEPFGPLHLDRLAPRR